MNMSTNINTNTTKNWWSQFAFEITVRYQNQVVTMHAQKESSIARLKADIGAYFSLPVSDFKLTCSDQIIHDTSQKMNTLLKYKSSDLDGCIVLDVADVTRQSSKWCCFV